MNRFSDVDIAGISADYDRHIRETCKGELPIALQLSGRLDPARWKLEWNSAAWVGEALSIDEAVQRQITVANVLGLAAIVLLDDLEDGELDLVGLEDPAAVAEELYQFFMAPYRLLFERDSPFWAERDRLMTSWRTATTNAASGSAASASSDAIGNDLAARGAPLKISVTALCMLADSPRTLALLDDCLDQTLTAMVLYDHFVDWRSDLEAGRWNAFATAATDGLDHKVIDPTPTDVEVAMLSTEVASAYFRTLETKLEHASDLAAEARVPGLCDHLSKVSIELATQGGAVAARYKALGRRAQEIVFGGYPIQAA